MKKILIISHKDADGITSAISFIWNILEKENLSKNLRNIKKYSDIIYYEYSYDLKKIFKEQKINLKNYNKIVLLDLSLDLNQMLLFYKLFKKDFIWIDHHKRPDKELEDKFSKLKIKIEGLRDHRKAACYLVWKYFKKEPPEFVKYIQDMDLWKFTLKDSKNFMSGIPDLKEKYTSKNINFILNMFNFDYFNKKKEEIINKGKIITEHQKDFVLRSIFYGKIIKFHNYKTFIINTQFNSGIFADFLFKKKEYKDIDILITWYKEYKNNQFLFSLRKNPKSKADLSKLAKIYGGGGHISAAGFCLDSLAKFKFSTFK